MCYHQVLISSLPAYLASIPPWIFSLLFTKEDFELDRLGRLMLKVSSSVFPLCVLLSRLHAVSQGVERPLTAPSSQVSPVSTASLTAFRLVLCGLPSYSLA